MLGRFGACLAGASSLLAVAALPGAASAHDNTQQQGPGHFSIRLTPEEVATGGNPGGSGEARLDLDQARETACYFLEWRGLKGDVTAAHLHVGPRLQDGPHVIDFFNDQHFAGRRSTASGCVRSSQDTIQAIIGNPSGYYINIHTTEFKPGAIRGQLG
ncbi:MAG: CHRD domain-containing protein [Pseudonocardiaceae bacterium]